MTERAYHVLFLCTGNTARSIMAEGLLNELGKGRFIAHSAGSFPKGSVNPYALEVLAKLQASTSEARSKSWDEFAGPHALPMDFVITVCDNAAGEVCPIWPGQPMTAHWGVEDPAAAVGTPEEISHKFMEVALILRRRIELFISLPLHRLDALALGKAVREIANQ